MEKHRFVRWSAPAVLLAAFILVPFALYEHEAEQAVAGYIAAQRGAQRSPAAALVLAALLCADVLLPIPSSLVAAASGFLLGWPRGALVNWLGLNAGAVLGYWIGSTAGRAALRSFVGERGLARAAGAHRRWGDWSLIVSRAVPVLAEAAVVFAGAARMPRARRPAGRPVQCRGRAGLCVRGRVGARDASVSAGFHRRHCAARTGDAAQPREKGRLRRPRGRLVCGKFWD